jgi:hypothetical protein
MAINAETALFNVLQNISVADTEQAGIGATTPSEEPTPTSETKGEVSEKGTDDSHLPVVPTKVTNKTLFSHPDSHPVVLDLVLLAKYGPEWLGWEPETVQFRIGQDFGNLSDLAMSKIMAMNVLHVSDRFWEAWEVFVWCSMPLNGIFPDFEIMQVPTVAQCMVAVDIANRVRVDVPWSEELKRYLEQVHLHDGIFVPQAPLDSFVEVDVRHLDVDQASLKAKWAEVRRTGHAPVAQTTEAEQLRRMLTVHEYLEDSRRRLQGQLHLIQHA